MRLATKLSGIVAIAGVAALGAGLISSGGIGANFISQTSSTATVNVGKFSCELSSTSDDVKISTTNTRHDTAKVKLPNITASAASSETAPITVTNTGDSRLAVVWTVTTSGDLFSSGTGVVAAAPVVQGLEINPNNARTYNIGFDWGILGNGDLGKGGSAEYEATCVEVNASHPGTFFTTANGGQLAWNSDGQIVFTFAGTSDQSGDAGAIFTGTDLQKLPTSEPKFTQDQNNSKLGTARWQITMADGTQLLGWPSDILTSGNWRINLPDGTSNYYVPWSTVSATYSGKPVADVRIATGEYQLAKKSGSDGPLNSLTIQCADFTGSSPIFGTGC